MSLDELVYATNAPYLWSTRHFLDLQLALRAELSCPRKPGHSKEIVAKLRQVNVLLSQGRSVSELES
jgi:hypothetical protein